MMKGELTKTSVYSEIREWYLNNMDELPDELNGLDIIYTNVRFTVQMWIEYIDGVIAKYGRPNDHAKVCKEKLLTLYFDLENHDAWNVGLPQKSEDL